MKFAHVLLMLAVAPAGITFAQDSYQWLRDESRQSPQVLEYLQQHNRLTDEALLPLRDLQHSLLSQWQAMTVNKADEPWQSRFAMEWKLSSQRGELSLLRRANAKAQAQLVYSFAPRQAQADYYQIGAWAVSRDQSKLLFSEDIDGSERYQLVEVDLKQGGEKILATSGSVLANASENALVTLEQNTLALLAEMTTDQMRSGVSLLAQDLSFDGKSLTAALLTQSERAALLANIVSEVQRRIGHNDTGATRYFTDGDQEVAEAQESYPGQDAEYGLDNSDQQTLTGNGFKFVKLDAKGQTLADASSVQFKDRTFVFESQTFKPYSDDLQVVGCVEAKDNLCSTQQYVAHMNQQNLCGITQWRLPTYLEFYDIIDFGETAKDENDQVYGLDVRYFPQQTQGSPDLNTGAIWLNNISFNNYSPYQTLGAVQYPVVATKGADRGYVSFVEIYSDKVTPDSGTSFQFPIRLVAAKEQ